MAKIVWGFALAFVLGITVAGQGAQAPRQGQMRGGAMMHDAQHDEDMAVFQALIDHRQQIQRTVVKLPDGIETVTQSDDPEIVKLIQTHVNAMYGRVKDGRPIHVRDPLFAAIFDNHDKIVMKQELTPTGIKVTETSTDPYVVKLVQAHADVLDLFIKNGRPELMKNHDVPPRP